MSKAIDILDARENKVLKINNLIKKYQHTLVCLSINIPGDNKSTKITLAIFNEGVRQLEALLAASNIKVTYNEHIASPDGNTCLWLIDDDSKKLKKLTLTIESSHPLGRLFDFDVFDQNGESIKRIHLHSSLRNCIVCGKSVHDCRFMARHSLDEIKNRVTVIYGNYANINHKKWVAEKISQIGGWAMQLELAITPKPGLVDRNNSGAHKDMDYFTFLKSIPILTSYFYHCAILGYEATSSSLALLSQIRKLGLDTEWQMTQITHGVNTLKGLIFSGGLLTASAGHLYGKGLLPTPHLISNTIKGMCKNMVKSELTSISDKKVTAGQKAYQKFKITGIRGEAENGFPTLFNFGRPIFSEVIEEGYSLEIAGVSALVAIMSNLDDTNLINRGNINTLKQVQEKCKKLIDEKIWQTQHFLEAVREMDEEFIRKNYSPGGAADILSLTFMMYLFENGNF